MAMTTQSTVIALGLAVLFVAVGEILGKRAPLLRRVPLPGAVIGGILILLVGSDRLDLVDGQRFFPSAPIRDALERLREFPGLFINVVFACLILGRTIEHPSVAWRQARPHIVMGHVIAWGQHVVGLTLVVFVLGPVLGLDDLAGPLVAIGFQGGHGTAAGLAPSFEGLGFAEGEAMALAVATIGVFAGAVGGPVLASALRRRDRAAEAGAGAEGEEEGGREEDGTRERPSRDEASVASSPLTGLLTLHVALIALVIGLAQMFLSGLIALERSLRSDSAGMIVTEFVPLFSVVLIAGYGCQLLLQRTQLSRTFEREIFRRLAAFGLDMVIVSALGTLSLSVVGRLWVPIALLSAAGLAWNLAVFFLLGPRLYRAPWYVYGLGDLGGGTATTATGLLLIRSADPERRTPALSSYADKQPFYEPLMGGGLVTALALVTVATIGPLGTLLIATTVLSAWLAYAARLVRNASDDDASSHGA